MKEGLRRILLIATLVLASAQAQVPAAKLTLRRNSAGETLATASGTIPACGLTALNEVPRFQIEGSVITVAQPVVGVACMNPPPKEKHYEQTLNLGKLAPGAYTINWSFPALAASYESPGK